MPCRRPPGQPLSLKGALFCIFAFLPLIAVAQQQHSQPRSNALKQSPSVEEPIRKAPRLSTTLGNPYRNGKDTEIVSNNERAIATVAPAGSNPAVRAGPARSSAQSAGLSPRHPARSLQDWQVEDIILLATVDGKIHARDRKTGKARWELEADRPMVETVYHRNKSEATTLEHDDFLWIVEPSQDGSLYVYAPGPRSGMQKLGLTVKQLVEELSPYAGEDPPVVYTADKKNTLFTIDAATGNILKMFSSTGSVTNNDRSCNRISPLEPLEDEECESIGTLTLGRTEYTIAIQDKFTGDAICTIRYFEWGPNNRDKDLSNQYASTMDNKYVYVQHDGGVYAVDHRQSNGFDASILFTQKFSSPVARVYDVVRQSDDTRGDPSLVLLPQPIGPVGGDTSEDDKIFVNCTESGSWYAMSEQKYPTVTDGAKNAVCYTDDIPSSSIFRDGKASATQRKRLVGIHPLSLTDERQSMLTIGGTDGYPLIGAAPEEMPGNETRDLVKTRSSWVSNLPSAWIIVILAMIGLWTLRDKLANVQKGDVWLRALLKPQASVQTPIEQSMAVSPEPAETTSPDAQTAQVTIPEIVEPVPERRVRFPEPAEETVFPQPEVQPGSDSDKAVVDEQDEARMDSPHREPSASASAGPTTDDEYVTVDPVATPDGTPAKPKKKATRGVRGGRKAKAKKQEQLEAQQRRRANSQNSDHHDESLAMTSSVEFISPADSEKPDVKGQITINSLTINTDRVIGHGSAGTTVFEGLWEGHKKVAVKRMLAQYYEMATQEISFLQENDYHKNVVRYHCTEKDQHFLYIAVELCQASLWDLFYSDTKDEERREQLSQLVTAVQQDVHNVLYQLIEGLLHLHDLRIIHRDIKPQNILIAYPKRGQRNDLRLVISDFGLCKTLPDHASTVVDATSGAGTSGWKAPELINQPRDLSSNNSHSNMSQPNEGSSNGNGTIQGVKRAADIFSLGCLFFWVLTGGEHPFDDNEGWMQMRELNIKKNNLQNMHKLDLGSDCEEPMHLISAMLSHKPEDRPTAREVKNHPFFWDAEKRLAFLVDVSDHFEHEPRDPPSEQLETLESYGPHVLGNDFLRRLDPAFVDTLGKQRKYTGSRMLDLLRALRNKKNHYEDMPEDVKKRVGPLPEGYLQYWTSRFPKLLMACHDVVRECGVDNGNRFRRYFNA